MPPWRGCSATVGCAGRYAEGRGDAGLAAATGLDRGASLPAPRPAGDAGGVRVGRDTFDTGSSAPSAAYLT